MNDRCLVSRFAENCTQQNIRYIEDLNSAHTQTLALLDYWLHYSEKSINDVSKAQSSKLKIFHHNCNTEITPSVLFYLLFLPSHGLVITQCQRYCFLFSCRLDTDVTSSPSPNPSISHTASAPRNEDNKKKASTFWKGHYFHPGHKLDEKSKDLLSSGTNFF